MSTDYLDTKRPNSTGHKPGGISGIRRNRPSYSCEGCRSRRVKCDLVHPQCGSCARNGMTCVYPNSTIKRTSSSEGKARPTCNKGSRRKSANIVPASEDVPRMRSPRPHQSFWATLDNKSHDVNSLLGGSTSSLVRLCNSGFDSMGCEPPTHQITTESHPFLNVYEHMTTESRNDQFRLGRLLEKLPDRSTCDYFYAVYLCSVHPITPYFHYPTFDGRYRRFWRWFERWDRMSVPQGILAEIPSFLPLLIATLYYGAVVEPLVTTSRLAPDQTTEPVLFLSMGMQALGMVEFPNKTSLCSLTAFMLLQMDQLRCQDASACSFVAVAIRVAQGMGLHKEEVNASHDPVTAEERRRIWILLTHVDMLTARKSGLSPVLTQPLKHGNDFSELRDDFIGVPSADPLRHTYPPFILAKGRYEASLCARPILVRQMDDEPITLMEIQQFIGPLKQLERNTEARIARLYASDTSNILPFAAPGVITNSPLLWSRLRPDVHAYPRWAEATLRYITEQAYCDLYSLALDDVEIWDILREEAIPHFQAYLQHFINLCTTHGYQPHQWMYPGYHQPIQVVAILLVDMYREPRAAEDMESRILIERLFSVFHDQDDYSMRSQRKPLGSSTTQRPFASAWSNLEILRRKVWARLGFEPSISSIAASCYPAQDPTYLPIMNPQSMPSPGPRDIRTLWGDQHRQSSQSMVHNLQLRTMVDGSIHLQVPYYIPDQSVSQPNGVHMNPLTTSGMRLPGVRATDWSTEQTYGIETMNSEASWMLQFDGDYTNAQMDGHEPSAGLVN